MKRNVWKRAWNTFYQAAIPAGAAAFYSSMQTGKLSWGVLAFVLTSAASAGISAIQSSMFNKKQPVDAPEEE